MSKTNGKSNGKPTWDDLPALAKAGAGLNGATPAKLRENLVLRAVILLDGYSETGRLCAVSPKAVMKWAKQKRLPRTEATGETQYAAIMAKANPEINEEALRKTAFRTRGKVKRVNEIGCPTYR
jgi:hypothetical protein